jgi:Tol biopolymer transport system component
MRSKNSERAARPLSALIAGGAVVVGVILLFGLPPDRLPTATAAATPTIIRFTVNEGTNISITRPPTGQSIIMDLHGFLYRLPPQGGQAVRITDVFQDAARPEVSPNGQRIAFQGYDATNGGHFHVVLVNPDGSSIQKLTTGNYDDREPAWSRDGTHIAFSSDRATGQ